MNLAQEVYNSGMTEQEFIRALYYEATVRIGMMHNSGASREQIISGEKGKVSPLLKHIKEGMRVPVDTMLNAIYQARRFADIDEGREGIKGLKDVLKKRNMFVDQRNENNWNFRIPRGVKTNTSTAERLIVNARPDAEIIKKLDVFCRQHKCYYKIPNPDEFSTRVDTVVVYAQEILSNDTKTEFAEMMSPYVRKERTNDLDGEKLADGVFWAAETSKPDDISAFIKQFSSEMQPDIKSYLTTAKGELKMSLGQRKVLEEFAAVLEDIKQNQSERPDMENDIETQTSDTEPVDTENTNNTNNGNPSEQSENENSDNTDDKKATFSNSEDGNVENSENTNADWGQDFEEPDNDKIPETVKKLKEAFEASGITIRAIKEGQEDYPFSYNLYKKGEKPGEGVKPTGKLEVVQEDKVVLDSKDVRHFVAAMNGLRKSGKDEIKLELKGDNEDAKKVFAANAIVAGMITGVKVTDCPYQLKDLKAINSLIEKVIELKAKQDEISKTAEKFEKGEAKTDVLETQITEAFESYKQISKDLLPPKEQLHIFECGAKAVEKAKTCKLALKVVKSLKERS